MYDLDDMRQNILRHPARYKTLTCGRGFGKTILALAWLIEGQMEPMEKRFYCAPTQKMARGIAWDLLKQIVTPYYSAGMVKISETDMSITFFPSQAKIILVGLDSPDRLRGVRARKVVVDEFSFLNNPEEIWNKIIRPMLALKDAEGEGLIIGTPFGHNHQYELHMRGEDPKFPDWKSWQYTSLDGGYITPQEFELARLEMDKQSFLQEMCGEFIVPENRVFYNFNRVKHLATPPEGVRAYGPGIKHGIGIDYNVEWMSAQIFSYLPGQWMYAFDEVRLKDSNTYELAKVLQKEYPQYDLFPDPSGKSRKTSSFDNDHEILRQHGFNVLAKSKHPSVRDSIASVNTLLENAAGETKLYINPKCTNLIKDMEAMTWHKNFKEVNKLSDPSLTHAADALRYGVDYLMPMKTGSIGLSKIG